MELQNFGLCQLYKEIGQGLWDNLYGKGKSQKQKRTGSKNNKKRKKKTEEEKLRKVGKRKMENRNIWRTFLFFPSPSIGEANCWEGCKTLLCCWQEGREGDVIFQINFLYILPLTCLHTQPIISLSPQPITDFRPLIPRPHHPSEHSTHKTLWNFPFYDYVRHINSLKNPFFLLTNSRAVKLVLIWVIKPQKYIRSQEDMPMRDHGSLGPTRPNEDCKYVWEEVICNDPSASKRELNLRLL